MNCDEIIEKIGGGNISEAARQLRVPYATLANWKASGRIPHWRIFHIQAVADRMRVKLNGSSDE